MATREKGARNAAAVAYLRGIKGARLDRITNEDIAASTGINIDQVKRLMTNRATLSVDDFLSIANALGVSDADALSSLADVVLDEGL